MCAELLGLLAGCAKAPPPPSIPATTKAAIAPVAPDAPDAPDAPVKNRLQLARYGPAAAVVDGKIYVIGGATPQGIATSVERFDLKTGASKLLATPLKPRYFGAAQAVGPFIYIFGGEDENENHSTRVERLDTRTLQVKNLTPCPKGRRLIATARVGDKIYLAGGTDSRGVRSAELWIYSIAADKWTPGAPMLVAKETDLVARGQTLYAVGGYDGQSALTDFEAYDTATGKWRALAPMPFAGSAHHGAIVGDTLWEFGDYTNQGRVSAYNFKSKRWRVVKNTGFTPRRHTAVAAPGAMIRIFGGNTGSAASTAQNAAQRFDPAKEKVVPVP